MLLAIAAPWHVLATLRNPPYFDFTMHSESGSYHGFFWFYFINEHLLRFLNLRYPRDYNTVPRLYFWLFHLLWLFPWSVYFPAVFRLKFRGADRASRVRLLALCWCGFVLVFFTFSTTQEYYSMPCYPALALLLGSAIASEDADAAVWDSGDRGGRDLAAVAIGGILWMVRGLAAPGRYRGGAESESGRLHAVAGTHDGPDDAGIRVLAAAAGGGRSGVRGGRCGAWRASAAAQVRAAGMRWSR